MKDYGTTKRGLFDTLRNGTLYRMRQKRKGYGVSLLGDAHAPTFSDGRAVMPSSMLAGLRDAGDAHDIVRLGHTGWFTDDCQDGTLCGHVWQLPARNGEPQYLAGYDEGNGYAVLSATGASLDIYDSKEDAAHAADSLAERDAKEEREYQLQANAANELQDGIDMDKSEMGELRSESHVIAETIRQLQLFGTHVSAATLTHWRATFAVMREKHRDMLRKVIADRDNLNSNYKDYI